MSTVVPETPEHRYRVRRSLRISSRRSSLLTSPVTKILQTPDTDEASPVKRIIQESPEQREGGRTKPSILKDKVIKGRRCTNANNNASNSVAANRLFPKLEQSPTSEETFINYVVASQDQLASTRLPSPTPESDIYSRGKTFDSDPKSRLSECSTSQGVQGSTAYKDILKNVVALVDVVYDDRINGGVAEQLRLLGAKVSTTLNRDVTHVIFKDGSLARYNKAKRLNLHIVSVSWIEACKEALRKVCEADYPSASREKYDSPTTALISRRRNLEERRIRALDTEQRFKRHLARSKRRQQQSPENDVAPLNLVPLDYYHSPRLNIAKSTKSPRRKSLLDKILESDDTLADIRLGVEEEKKSTYTSTPSCSPKVNGESPFSDDYDTPLSLRIAKKFYADRKKRDRSEDKEEEEEEREEDCGASPSLKKAPNDKKDVSQEEKENNLVLIKSPRRRPLFRHKLFSNNYVLSETPPRQIKADVKHPEKPDYIKNPENLKKVKPRRLVIKEESKNKRRSSEDFVSPRCIDNHRRQQRNHAERKEIVCTSCSAEDIQLIRQIATKFDFDLGKTVTRHTSHVICGVDPVRRTLNVLRGLLRGCWIVSKAWIFASLEEGILVDEEPYEKIDFSRAVRTCRVERISFGSFESTLLKDVGSLYLSRKADLSTKDLGELVRLGGGRVAASIEEADIIIGDKIRTDVYCVSDKWILDSIQHHFLLPLIDYAL